jgi:cytochrome c oxidase cbb3-type subunit 3
MTTFWSLWVAILSMGCWLFVTGALIFVLRMKPKLEEDGTTGHVVTTAFVNMTNPCHAGGSPFFWLSIVWGLGYFAAYPSLGNWEGFLRIQHQDGSVTPWTSAEEMRNDFDRNNTKFLEGYQKNFAGMTVADMSDDPRAIKMGQRLFLQNCSVCHGSSGKGALGFPNLTDNDWLYGGTPEKIVETLHKGRIGGMPAWKDKFGEDGVKATAEYVMSLSGRGNLNGALLEEGQKLFKANCVACHGADGKGTMALGAPNLTDNHLVVWWRS